jgi:hypothetical protein
MFRHMTVMLASALQMSSWWKTAGFAAVAALVAAAAASLYGAAATSASRDRSQSLVARTVDCKLDPVDVNAALQISAFASKPSDGAAEVSIATGSPSSPTALLSLSSKQRYYELSSLCHSVPRRVVMSRNGLTPARVVEAGDAHSPIADCASPGHVWIRFVLRLNPSETPVSAKIEITQPHARLKPLGHVEWSPQQSVTYYRPGTCAVQEH